MRDFSRVQRERVRARLPLRLRERGGLVQPTHMERDRLRREREEREKLRLQREGLERERRQLEKDRQERERLEQERIRLEQERKRELEHIEREKAEMRRLQEITRLVIMINILDWLYNIYIGKSPLLCSDSNSLGIPL